MTELKGWNSHGTLLTQSQMEQEAAGVRDCLGVQTRCSTCQPEAGP